MKSWLQRNNIEMCSIHNDGKSVVAERFIRALKNKIYKHITSVSKHVYMDKLDDIVDKYNNKYHRTIQTKPIDVNLSANIDLDLEKNNKDIKFEIGDYVRISKYKKRFAQGVTPSCSGEIFVIKIVENTLPWTSVIKYFNGEEIIATFY